MGRPDEAQRRQQLTRILQELRALATRPGSSYAWSSWSSPAEAARAIDVVAARVAAGKLPRRDLARLFAPTGAAQELAVGNGWGDRFLTLASECEALLDG